MAGRADVFIGGSIGPIGELEDVTGTARREHFAEQARILEGRGADLFLVETFFDLDELVTAIEAVQGVSSLPVVAMLSFDEDAQTAAGVRRARRPSGSRSSGWRRSARTTAPGLLAGLAALEAMGRRPAARGDAEHRPREPRRRPRRLPARDARSTSPSSPPTRATSARALIGGCCGTTPAEIAAIHRALAERAAGPRAARLLRARARRCRPPARRPRPSSRGALREGEWVVSVQIDPPLGGRNDGMLDTARRAQGLGARAAFLDINDNPMARARMSALMAAVAIEGAVGIETIPHQTPRDTTLMGLESMLLGAHAAGVRNVLAVTGDPPAVGDYPGSHGVYEVDSIGLVHMIARLNRGEDYNGKAIDAPTVVLHRRRRQPVGRRPGARARALPAQGRGAARGSR